MALHLDSGSYRYLALAPNSFSLLLKAIKYDDLLHQSLDKIICERCLSSSDQIKVFLRGPHLKSIIKPILDQEPILSRHLSKEEFEKLSLLWIAVLGCYEKSAELLVRSGADVNELFGRRDLQAIDEKWTILHMLLHMVPSPENERLIRLVIDHGADLQARDCNRRTVVQYAVINVRIQMIKLLLKKGADINVADDQGMTPLLFAVDNKKAIELVPLLIKHGAEVLAKSRNGQNALHRLAYGCWEHGVDLARILIEKGVSLNDEGYLDKYQPIHEAIKVGYIKLVELYLDHGANVNALTAKGESPLHLAAQFTNCKMAKILLKRGANIGLRSIDGRTALHVVCERATSPTVTFSLEISTYHESEAYIRLLLSAGADVLAEDCNGMTPLALISSGEHVDQPGSRLLIRKLALQKKVYQPSIELKDEAIIELYPDYQNYYQKCIEEIEKMKVTRFIETCNLFQLLTKNYCQISALMRNPEFKPKFKQCDLSGFHYAVDIQRAFNLAKDHYDALLEQENVINEAVYDSLPYLIVRKVAHYCV